MTSVLVLNPEQQKAVEYGEGPLLVIAGPGSGKTRVITQRIVHLLGRASASGSLSLAQPANILALTFTEKAAEEMKRRIQEALPGLEKLPSISTFHAFCYHVLRERHFERRLLDEIDVWIFLRRRMEQLALEFYRKLAEPGAFLHDLNEFFSRCQDELIEPDDFEAYVKRVESDFARKAADLKVGFTRDPLDQTRVEEDIQKKKELARVFRKSRELIEEAGCSSFGSLISETICLWEREPEALERYRSRFRFVLVDEYQDTNFAQVELLKRLVAPPYNITAVGDDDQAVYRFRGASHGAFQMFDLAFPNHQTVYLRRNYRSTKRILRVADVIISRNDRYERKEPLKTENPEGSKVCLVESPDYSSEATWVAAEVARLVTVGSCRQAEWQPKAATTTSPVRLGDIAVLYRSHQSRDLLVGEFRRRSIPFVIRGLSVLSTTVLRDLVAYLHLIHSPHHNVSLTRVLLAPRWRFPEELAVDIRRQAGKDRCSLFDVLQARERMLFNQELPRTGWPELKHLLRGLHEASRRLSMPSLFDLLLDRLGLCFLPGDRDKVYVNAFRKFLEVWEEKKRNGVLSAASGAGVAPSACRSDSLLAAPRLNSDGACGGDVESPLRDDTRSPLQEFMEYLRYFQEAGGQIETPDPPDSSNTAQLMTVHAAKGLEFPVVFVLGVGRQRFPHREERPVIEFPDALRKGPPAPTDVHLQEERSLFYVALTRACERLYVSSVTARGKKPSVFVDDLLSDPTVVAYDIERFQAAGPVAVGESLAHFGAARTDAGPPGGVSRHTPTVQVSEPRSMRRPVQGHLFETVLPASPELSAVRPNIIEWATRIDANGLPPPAVGHETCPASKLRLSATMIESYRECPMKFKFTYHYRIPTAPQATLTFGNIMHQCVRHYFDLRRQGLPHFDQLGEFFLHTWKGTGFEDTYQEQEYQRAGLDQLREFTERQNNTTLAASEIELERGFSLELDDVVLVGRIDQINPLPQCHGALRPADAGLKPGSRLLVELIDYKTGRPRSQKDADKSLQLSVYALVARRLLQLEPARLTFYNLTNNEAVSTVRTTKAMDNAMADIHKVAAQIRKGLFDPMPGFACRRCEYVAICPAHEEP